ncbi:MAG: hypothetical protein ACP5GS_08715 [Nitrososphaeria archaeon]
MNTTFNSKSKREYFNLFDKYEKERSVANKTYGRTTGPTRAGSRNDANNFHDSILPITKVHRCAFST